jgi:hypothetical protein
MLAVQAGLIAAGKFSWAFFTPIYGAPSPTRCTAWFREAAPPLAGRALMMGFSKSPALALEDVATFLLVRGPYAYLGWGWLHCLPPPPLPALRARGLRRAHGKPHRDNVWRLHSRVVQGGCGL